MYEVACPSCHAVVATPFVRIGAVLTCKSCKHRYLIDATHVKRVPGVKPGGVKPETTDIAEAGRVFPGGVRDLTELMRREAERERDSRFNDYDTIAPTADPPRPPIIPEPVPAVSATPPRAEAPPPATPISQTPSKRQQVIRRGYFAVAVVALTLAVVGVVLLFMFKSFMDDGSTDAILPVEPPQPVEPIYEGPVFQGLPLVEPVMLTHTPWELPNRPFVSHPQTDDAVYVADDRLVPGGAGEILYTCRIVSEKPGVLIRGNLTVSLVTPQGTESARTVVPFALISADQSQLIQVPIPASLDPTTLHPVWSIGVVEWSQDTVFLEDVSVYKVSSGADTMARVLLFNNTGRRIEQATLLITAWGDGAQPLRRWRVYWPLPIEPDRDVEFFTRTPVLPAWDIREWTVSAAG